MNFKLLGKIILVVNIKFGYFFGPSTQPVSGPCFHTGQPKNGLPFGFLVATASALLDAPAFLEKPKAPAQANPTKSAGTDALLQALA